LFSLFHYIYETFSYFHAPYGDYEPKMMVLGVKYQQERILNIVECCIMPHSAGGYDPWA